MLYKVKLMQANVRNKNNYLYTSEILKSLNFLINNRKIPVYNNISNESTYGKIIGYSVSSYIKDGLLYVLVDLKEEAKFIGACISINFSQIWRKVARPPIGLSYLVKNEDNSFFYESNVYKIEKLSI